MPKVDCDEEENEISKEGEADASKESGLLNPGAEATAGNLQPPHPGLSGSKDKDDEEQTDKIEPGVLPDAEDDGQAADHLDPREDHSAEAQEGFRKFNLVGIQRDEEVLGIEDLDCSGPHEDGAEKEAEHQSDCCWISGCHEWRLVRPPGYCRTIGKPSGLRALTSRPRRPARARTIKMRRIVRYLRFLDTWRSSQFLIQKGVDLILHLSPAKRTCEEFPV